MRMRGGTTKMAMAEFLEIVGEHSDYAGYAAIRQRMVNQSGGGRSEREFLRLQVEVYLGAFLREIDEEHGMSKLHVRILDPRFEMAR
jgi:hypothetical protein